MPSFGGLISGVMGRAAEGYGKAADMEMKKQSELDLRKQLMEAETEKQLRIDEIKRGRDIADIPLKSSAEARARFDNAIVNADADALIEFRGFEARNKIGLPAQKAQYQTAEYEAGKPLAETKAAAATTAKILETKTLSESDDFIKGETKLSEAKGAAGTKQAQIKADALKDRPSGSGAGGKPKSETTADLDRIVKRSEADAARILGVDKKDLNRTYANLQKKKDPASVALLEKTKPYMDELDAASTRLKNWKAGVPQSSGSNSSSTGPRDLTKYERNKALND